VTGGAEADGAEGEQNTDGMDGNDGCTREANPRPWLGHFVDTVTRIWAGNALKVVTTSTKPTEEAGVTDGDGAREGAVAGEASGSVERGRRWCDAASFGAPMGADWTR